MIVHEVTDGTGHYAPDSALNDAHVFNIGIRDVQGVQDVRLLAVLAAPWRRLLGLSQGAADDYVVFFVFIAHSNHILYVTCSSPRISMISRRSRSKMALSAIKQFRDLGAEK